MSHKEKWKVRDPLLLIGANRDSHYIGDFISCLTGSSIHIHIHLHIYNAHMYTYTYTYANIYYIYLYTHISLRYMNQPTGFILRSKEALRHCN